MSFTISSPASVTSYKSPAKVASTANLALSDVIGILVDGIALSSLVTGDRILLKNQVTGSENGIYTLTISGANYSLARSLDADTSAKLSPNSLVPVSQGTVNFDSVFQLTNNSVNLGVDALVFIAVDSVALAAVAAEQARAVAAEALALQKASNLSDLASVGTAKTNLSLQNVDNTSDAAKPVSTAQQTALNLKANLISPVFTTPNIGSATGSISGNAATVTTNANLTGPVTSVGNATAIANSAISNAMLANAAVANLSGTNTGDNSANGLYTANPMTTAGDLIVGGVSGAQGRLAIGSTEKVLATDGTSSYWAIEGVKTGYPAGTVVLGRAAPASFSPATNTILIGQTASTLFGESVVIGESSASGGVNNVVIGHSANGALQNMVVIGKSAVTGGASAYGIGIGYNSSTIGESVVIGALASSSGNGHLVAIGCQAVAVSQGIAIGQLANATTQGLAIGYGATCLGATGMAIGHVANTGSGANSLIIGYSSGISGLLGDNNTVVGADSFNGASLTTANANTILGKGVGKVLTTGSSNTILGQNSAGGLTSGVGNVIIGAEAGTSGTNNPITTGTYNVAVGYAASADPTVTFATALGTNAGARASYALSIGGYSQTNGTYAVVLGYKSRAYDRSITIGGESLWSDYGGTGNFIVGTYARNPSVLNNISAFGGPAGSSAHYTIAYWGQGLCPLAGASLINFTNTVTPAYGTDQNATTGTLTIAGAISTGTGIGGDIIFSTSPAGGAGSAQNASVERARVTHDGRFQVSSVTASQILASGASKEVVSLSTATYPSLTELAYVKGVTSAVQTQLNSEATARAAADLLAVPAQSGNTEKVLATNGSSTYWAIEGIKTGYPTGSTILGRLKPASISGTYNTLIGDSAGSAMTTAGETVAIGHLALSQNTTGSENSAIGAHALEANTTGYSNTAIGLYALQSNISGYQNIGIGSYALNHSTGNANVAVGLAALYINTSGSNNVAVGTNALRLNTTASNNVAVGSQALYNNTTGSNNVAMGTDALKFNTTGIDNIGIGPTALQNNTTGTKNVFIGSGSGYSLTTGGSNNGMGWFALRSATTGNENVALGDYSLSGLTTGSNSVAVGGTALSSTTTGGNNVAVGWHALTTNVTGGANVALGYAAGRNNAGSFNTFIGDSVNCNWTNATSTGDYNTITGAESFYVNTSGAANSAFGAYNLCTNTTGQDNSVLGCVSLYANTTGSYNVAIGREVLYVNTTGSESIAIGHFALKSNITGSSNVAIGSNAGRYATAGNEFYLNNQNRVNIAGDKSDSLMYGQFNATASSQTLAINAAVSIPYNLSLATGLKVTANADPGAQTDSIAIGAKDSTSGTPSRTLHLRTEEAVVTNAAVVATHSVNVWINNVEYKIMLVAV